MSLEYVAQKNRKNDSLLKYVTVYMLFLRFYCLWKVMFLEVGPILNTVLATKKSGLIDVITSVWVWFERLGLYVKIIEQIKILDTPPCSCFTVVIHKLKMWYFCFVQIFYIPENVWCCNFLFFSVITGNISKTFHYCWIFQSSYQELMHC